MPCCVCCRPTRGSNDSWTARGPGGARRRSPPLPPSGGDRPLASTFASLACAAYRPRSSPLFAEPGNVPADRCYATHGARRGHTPPWAALAAPPSTGPPPTVARALGSCTRNFLLPYFPEHQSQRWGSEAMLIVARELSAASPHPVHPTFPLRLTFLSPRHPVFHVATGRGVAVAWGLYCTVLTRGPGGGWGRARRDCLGERHVLVWMRSRAPLAPTNHWPVDDRPPRAGALTGGRGMDGFRWMARSAGRPAAPPHPPPSPTVPPVAWPCQVSGVCLASWKSENAVAPQAPRAASAGRGSTTARPARPPCQPTHSPHGGCRTFFRNKEPTRRCLRSFPPPRHSHRLVSPQTRGGGGGGGRMYRDREGVPCQPAAWRAPRAPRSAGAPKPPASTTPSPGDV